MGHFSLRMTNYKRHNGHWWVIQGDPQWQEPCLCLACWVRALISKMLRADSLGSLTPPVPMGASSEGRLPSEGWGVPVCAGGQAFLYACCQPPMWAQTGSLPYKDRRGGADLIELQKSTSILRTLKCLRERSYFFQQHCNDHTLQKRNACFFKSTLLVFWWLFIGGKKPKTTCACSDYPVSSSCLRFWLLCPTAVFPPLPDFSGEFHPCLKNPVGLQCSVVKCQF